MSLSTEQIDWIVAEVIRRLKELESTERRVPVFSGTPENTADVTIKDNVITLRSIENRLSGMNRLIIPQKSVVTPAVKDELKQRKIELVRQ